jgi:hypothetical protein
MGIGTLMNARRLMELIIINIGLHRVSSRKDSLATLVMDVITALMASPIFDRLGATGAGQLKISRMSASN